MNCFISILKYPSFSFKMFSRNNYYAFHLIVLLFLIIGIVKWYLLIFFLTNVFFLWIIEISVDSVQIRVENKGGYVARVLVRYQNSKGEEQSHNTGTFPVLQTASINLDDSTKSIEIEVQMYSLFSSFRTIFKLSSPCPHTRCFVIWGTIFNAGWGENCCQ